ncbi:MAG: RluA family pseudouridine synthase, partial [Acidobacteria bacterium]|nr:RluA family pseudouridine synthase [Acidobacteriota bacterium]
MSEPLRFTIPPELAGERLDRCLTRLHPAWTRSHVRRLIDGGHVQLAGRSPKPATTVAAGDVLTVTEPPPEPSHLEPEAMKLSIVFEDEHILVLDKPAGLVIHPAAGNPSGTLVNALLHHCDDLSGIGGVERPGIVHRLDKNTTGLMVVAKNDSAHQRLSLAFRRRQVHKTYLAVCYGVPDPAEGVVDAPIGRHPRERQRMAVVPNGRPSRTLYELREAFTGTALLACRLVTGRTHQIRVHMAHLGHALVGDPLYAGRQWRNLQEPARSACRNFPRQALHAHRLELTHPAT